MPVFARSLVSFRWPLGLEHPSVNAGNIQDGIRPWGVAELPFETGYVSIHSGPFRDNGQASSERHLPEESGAIKQEPGER